MSDKWGDIARTLGCEVTEEADALRKEVERLREALDAACLRAGHHQTISESRQEEVERLRSEVCDMRSAIREAVDGLWPYTAKAAGGGDE